MNLLYPLFRQKLETGLLAARAQGIMAYPFEAFRPNTRQEMLFNQGRIVPGEIVTQAKAGFSWHNYGLAADIVFDASPAPGIQWSWVEAHAGDYDKLAVILMKEGLEWLGNTLHDKPHFQLTMGLPIVQAYQMAQKFGILSIWDKLDNV
jgi:peptidoglycan LD-endopeptidase CwlK